jgi:uncharacterized protein involved in response to NO
MAGTAIFNALRVHWHTFSAAPHRLFFASGLVWLVAWSAWWVLLLVARQAGWFGFEPIVPALLLHGGVMLYLVLPPFMYGFLLTVFPRWQRAPSPPQNAMLAAFWLLNAGNLLMLLGLSGLPAGLFIGWVLAATAMAVVATVLVAGLVRADTRVSHAFTVVVGLSAGILGMTLIAFMLAASDFSIWPLARGLGLYGFLVVVYFSVCHRMIPFFSSRVVPEYVTWRPDWLLYLFTGLALARGLLEGAPGWAWLASLPLAVIALSCALRWRPRRPSHNRLLDVLHIAFAWLVAGLALAALADVAAALGSPGLVGRAALHALGMGFFGGMLMAMLTRVTMGHSGQSLVMDTINWRLFLLVQAATGLRVAAEFLPAASGWLSLLAAVTWLAAFGAWAFRHLPIYLRPREDGAPG